MDVSPGGSEAFLISRSPEGNHGTLGYTLGTSRLQLIVMWTSGMNCDHYANIMAVGVTDSLNSDKFRCADDRNEVFTICFTSTMYFEKQPWFRKQNFQYYPEPLVLEAATYQVVVTKAEAEAEAEACCLGTYIVQ